MSKFKKLLEQAVTSVLPQRQAPTAVGYNANVNPASQTSVPPQAPAQANGQVATQAQQPQQMQQQTQQALPVDQDTQLQQRLKTLAPNVKSRLVSLMFSEKFEREWKAGDKTLTEMLSEIPEDLVGPFDDNIMDTTMTDGGKVPHDEIKFDDKTIAQDVLESIDGVEISPFVQEMIEYAGVNPHVTPENRELWEKVVEPVVYKVQELINSGEYSRDIGLDLWGEVGKQIADEYSKDKQVDISDDTVEELVSKIAQVVSNFIVDYGSFRGPEREEKVEISDISEPTELIDETEIGTVEQNPLGPTAQSDINDTGLHY